MRRYALLVLIIVSLALGAAYRDVLFLKNGEEIRGNVIKITKKEVVIETKEGKQKYKIDEVVRLSLTHPRPGDEWETVDDITDSVLISALAIKDSAKAKYPKASYITLYRSVRVEFTRDGNCEYTLRHIGVVLNERGKADNAVKAIIYIKPWQYGDIDFCRTISPDGKVYHLDDAAIEFGEPLGTYPQYNFSRSIRFALPQLKVGSVFDYQFHIRYEGLSQLKPYWSRHVFGDNEPIINIEVTVKVPSEAFGNVFRYVMDDPANSGILKDLPDISEKDDYLILKWHAKEIPPYIPETNTAPPEKFNPTIWIGYGIGPNEVFNALSDSLRASLDGSQKLDKFVDSLLSGVKSVDKKVAKIYEYLNIEFRKAYAEPDLTRFFPRKVSEIFDDGVANHLDLCALAVYMLKRAGVNSGIIYVSDEIDKPAIFKMPILRMFKRIALFVDMPDGRTLLGLPYRKYLPLGTIPPSFEGQLGIWVSPQKTLIDTIPHCKLSTYGTVDTVVVEIDENGDGKIEIKKTYGNYQSVDMRYYREERKEEIDKDYETRSGNIHPGAKLISYEIKGIGSLDSTVRLFWSVTAPKLAQKAGAKMLAFQIPLLRYSTYTVGLPERKTPMWLPDPLVHERVWIITIPKKFNPYHIPQNIEAKLDSALYELKFEYEKSGNKIVVREKDIRTDKLIPPNEYESYRNLIFTKASAAKHWLILERKRK